MSTGPDCHSVFNQRWALLHFRWSQHVEGGKWRRCRWRETREAYRTLNCDWACTYSFEWFRDHRSWHSSGRSSMKHPDNDERNGHWDNTKYVRTIDIQRRYDRYPTVSVCISLHPMNVSVREKSKHEKYPQFQLRRPQVRFLPNRQWECPLTD